MALGEIVDHIDSGDYGDYGDYGYYGDYGDYGDGKTFCERVLQLNLPYTLCDNATLCFHASLRCDGRSQCRDGTDESDCICPVVTRPREETAPQIDTNIFIHNYNKKEATFACRSKVRSGTDICAIRCDGNEECWKGLDEKGCDPPAYYVVLTILAALIVFSIILAEFGIYFQTEMPNTLTLKKLKITEDFLGLLVVEQPTFEQKKELKRLTRAHHKRRDFTQRLELISAVITMNPDREAMKRGRKALYDGILMTHDNSRRRAFMCIKKHIRNAEFLEAIQDAEDPGFFRKLVPKKLKTWFHQFSLKHHKTLYITFAITTLIKIIFHLLDLVKDVTALYLVAAVTFSLHGQENDLKTTWQNAPVNFTDYHVQLLLVLTLSVLLPLFINAFTTSKHHPGTALGMSMDGSKMSKPTLGLLTVSSLLLCVPTQVVVLWRLTRTQMEMTGLKVALQTDPSRRNITDILRLQQEEQHWEKILLGHKKTDVCLEISIQSIVDILMLLLFTCDSRSKQVFGLEELFKGNEGFFYFALLVTIKKMVMTNLDLIQSKKGFLGFKGKVILGLQYLVSGCARVTSIVAFFAGPLGLFDILIGFQPEPPFAKPFSAAYIPVNLSTLDALPMYRLTVADVTLYPLSYYYVAFILFVVGHSILVFGLKQLFAPSFKRCPRWSDKIINVIHNCAFIEELEDFDEDPNTVTKGGLKKRFKETKKERGIIAGVFLVENVLLCLPLVFTCLKMSEFYRQLDMKTSLFPEELQAYSNCRTLVWLPLIIGAMSTLTFPLSFAYNRLGHPWKVLANSLEEEDDDNIDYCHQLNEKDGPGDEADSDSDNEELENSEDMQMATFATRKNEEDVEDPPEEESLMEGTSHQEEMADLISPDEKRASMVSQEEEMADLISLDEKRASMVSQEEGMNLE